MIQCNREIAPVSHKIQDVSRTVMIDAMSDALRPELMNAAVVVFVTSLATAGGCDGIQLWKSWLVLNH